MQAGTAATESITAAAPAAPTTSARTGGPRNWTAAAAAGPPPNVAPDQPRRFAMEEAIRLAGQGRTTQAGAYDILRWATRRRTVIQAALDELRLDTTIDADTRDAAAAILEHVLAVGFLY